MNTILLKNTLIAATQAELADLIEKNFDLPQEETWGESADRIEANGDDDSARILRAAEARWFDLT